MQHLQVEAENAGGGRKRARHRVRIWIVRVHEQRDSWRRRHEFVQDFELFRAKLGRQVSDAGDIAAGPGEIGDQPQPDRVAPQYEHDRGRRRRRFRLARGSHTSRDNHVYAPLGQISRQRQQAGILPFRPAVFQRHVLAGDVGGLGKAALQSTEPELIGVAGSWAQPANHRHAQLLRVHRERPRDRCAPYECHERAASHSITSSARPSSGSGTVSPSAVAVLRLMPSVYLSARCTGRSPALVPLRMRST